MEKQKPPRRCPHLERAELGHAADVIVALHEELRLDLPLTFELCPYCLGRAHVALLGLVT